MEQIATAEIHSIEIGDPKTGFGWTVGKPAFGTIYKVAKIVRDDTNFYIFGFVRYLIIIKNEKDQEIVWREYNDRHKLTITYSI